MKLRKNQKQLINQIYKTSSFLNLQTLCKNPHKQEITRKLKLLNELTERLSTELDFFDENSSQS